MFTPISGTTPYTTNGQENFNNFKKPREEFKGSEKTLKDITNISALRLTKSKKDDPFVLSTEMVDPTPITLKSRPLLITNPLEGQLESNTETQSKESSKDVEMHSAPEATKPETSASTLAFPELQESPLSAGSSFQSIDSQYLDRIKGKKRVWEEGPDRDIASRSRTVSSADLFRGIGLSSKDPFAMKTSQAIFGSCFEDTRILSRTQSKPATHDASCYGLAPVSACDRWVFTNARILPSRCAPMTEGYKMKKEIQRKALAEINTEIEALFPKKQKLDLEEELRKTHGKIAVSADGKLKSKTSALEKISINGVKDWVDLKSDVYLDQLAGTTEGVYAIVYDEIYFTDLLPGHDPQNFYRNLKNPNPPTLISIKEVCAANLFAVTNEKSDLMLLDFVTARKIKTYKFPLQARSLESSPARPNILMVGSYEKGKISIYDVRANPLERTEIALKSTKQQIEDGDGEKYLKMTRQQTLKDEGDTSVNRIKISPSGNYFAATCGDDVAIVDFRNGKHTGTIPHHSHALGLEFRKDDFTLITGSGIKDQNIRLIPFKNPVASSIYVYSTKRQVSRLHVNSDDQIVALYGYEAIHNAVPKLEVQNALPKLEVLKFTTSPHTISKTQNLKVIKELDNATLRNAFIHHDVKKIRRLGASAVYGKEGNQHLAFGVLELEALLTVKPFDTTEERFEKSILSVPGTLQGKTVR